MKALDQDETGQENLIILPAFPKDMIPKNIEKRLQDKREKVNQVYD